jgi:hypothetical protein
MAGATTVGPHAIAALGKALKFGRADALEINPPGSMDWPPVLARARRGLEISPGQKGSLIKY